MALNFSLLIILNFRCLCLFIVSFRYWVRLWTFGYNAERWSLLGRLIRIHDAENRVVCWNCCVYFRLYVIFCKHGRSTALYMIVSTAQFINSNEHRGNNCCRCHADLWKWTPYLYLKVLNVIGERLCLVALRYTMHRLKRMYRKLNCTVMLRY